MLNSPSSASTVLITQRAKKYIPVSRPPPPSNRQSSSGLMAREARLESESIASFADWIRSTGPKSVTNRASHPADSRPMQAQSQASNRMSGIISPTGLRPIIYSAGTSTTDPRQRNRLQPRDARTISPSNAELIDAIRVGPPHVGARVDPDAEQMRRSAGSGVENGTTLSVASSLQSRSYAASNSSRTPLVAGTRRIQGQASFENGIQVGSSTRKADPYNLGLNDPDDAHTTFNKSSKRTEMSMMDFLKDGPSEGPQPSSSFDDIPPPSPERAPRRGATLGALGSDLQDIPRRSNSFRTGNRSKYSEPVFDKATFGYEAQQSAGNVRVPEGAPRAPPVASDIRSAQRAGQNELADFFRNSAPPEAPKAVQRPLPRKEGSGFGKMFGRKKAAAYT